MEFIDEELFEFDNNTLKPSFKVVSTNNDVEDAEMLKVIDIIDEEGMQVSCTYDKFVEIFDEEGLTGFIM